MKGNGTCAKSTISLRNHHQWTLGRTCGFLTLRTTPMRDRTWRIQIHRSSDFSWIAWRIITPPLFPSDSQTWIPMVNRTTMEGCGDRGWNKKNVITLVLKCRMYHFVKWQIRYFIIKVTILLCKGKKQYLLTCKVSRYCLLPLHGSIHLLRLHLCHLIQYCILHN